jgi:predicted Fe-Mo cluster-binding NifX family protein
MKIAIPINEAYEFSAHYGAAYGVACFEADDSTRALRIESLLIPTEGSPCSWPDWFKKEGVTVMLVGGMGGGARARCEELGMEVIVGVPDSAPAGLAAAYLAGTLQPGESACRHGDHDNGHGHARGHDHDHGSRCNCAH